MIDARWLLAHEGGIRFAVFAIVLFTLALAERLLPRRGDAHATPRQGVNLAIALIDTLLLRVAFPLLAVGAAVWAHAHGVGLFNVIEAPGWLEFALTLLLLDLAIYLQHRLLHALPWLWRLHRVHHSDLAFDVTLGLRFHPLESALSMLLKMALAVWLGAPPLAVLVFEIALSAGALFSHADLALPGRIERALRRLLVTPDMHRVHHSVHGDELNRNFGFNLSCWDRLFGSYRDQPRDGHAGMQIGLDRFRDAREQRLLTLLQQPFVETSR